MKTSLIHFPISKTGNYNIPSSVTSIESGAFSNCTGLYSVSIPSSVSSINNSAFYGCSLLTDVEIPSSVNFIGSHAFSGRIFFIVDSGNPEYSSIDSVLFNKTRTTLLQCTTLKVGNYTVPSSVTSIGNYAFADCSNLITVEIPSSLNYIKHNTFARCRSLTSVIIPSSVKYIGYSAFED